MVGLLLAPLTASAQDRAANGTQIGVVARNLDGQPCLRVADSSLTPGLRLETASIPIDGWSDISGTAVLEIVSVRPGACAGFPGVVGDTDYLLRIIEGTVFALASGPSVAVVGGTARLVYRDGTLHMDLDGDGAPQTFRGCTSREGIHLTLWSGVPLESERLWHVGFPVGYDVIATCTEADVQGR